jgi:GNAT superfamily N-acetyltransferase
MFPTFEALTPSGLEAALDLMAGFYAEERLHYDEPRARHALGHLLANPGLGTFQFIRLADEEVGYFVLTVCFSMEFAGRFALLDEFYVDPAHRGRGFGAQAIDRIRRTALSFGVAAVRLEVDRANPRVRAFYRRNGFEPHDRDLMTLWL